jgi:hypothetical protein
MFPLMEKIAGECPLAVKIVGDLPGRDSNYVKDPPDHRAHGITVRTLPPERSENLSGARVSQSRRAPEPDKTAIKCDLLVPI